jgi:hypothetical protein
MSDNETETGTEAGAETSAATGNDAFGLTAIEAGPVQRVLVRRRESSVTTAAWRLEVTCDQGAGGIVRVDIATGAGEQPVYRGDGVFLGWSQERLAGAYDALSRPTDDGSSFELIQLG